MTPFEVCTLVLTAILALVGGGWTLIRMQSNLRQKIEDQKVNAVEKSILRIEKLIERLDRKVDLLDRKWTDQFAQFSEKLHNLRVTLTEITRETENARSSIVDGTKVFAENVRKMISGRADVEDLGNGMFRVKGGKKQDGE